MKNIIIYTATIVMSLSLWNCGNNKTDLTPDASRKVINLTPEWVEEPPQADNFIYTVASKTSRDYQTSITKADLEARKMLGVTIRSEIKGVATSAIEETGYSDDSEYIENFTNSAELAVDEIIQLAKVTKQKTIEEEDNFRSWVLIEFDQGIQHKMVLAKLKQDKVLAEKLRGSELLEEMEEKVEAYRKRKAQ